MATDSSKVNPDKAKQVLQEDIDKREKEAVNEINAILAKFNVKFDISMVLKSGSITPQIKVISN